MADQHFAAALDDDDDVETSTKTEEHPTTTQEPSPCVPTPALSSLKQIPCALETKGEQDNIMTPVDTFIDKDAPTTILSKQAAQKAGLFNHKKKIPTGPVGNLAKQAVHKAGLVPNEKISAGAVMLRMAEVIVPSPTMEIVEKDGPGLVLGSDFLKEHQATLSDHELILSSGTVPFIQPRY